MGWFILSQIFSTILEIAFLSSQTTQAKDLEILLLRRQLAILERKLDKPVRVSRAERLTLAVKLETRTGRTAKMLNEVIRIVQPETVLKWHRELVRRKWTHNRQRRGGRPRTDKALERLVVRLAKENGWGNC